MLWRKLRALGYAALTVCINKVCTLPLPLLPLSSLCILISLSVAREDEQVTAYAIDISKLYACVGCSTELDRLEKRAQSCSLPIARGNDLGFVSSAQQQIFSDLVGPYLLSILCQMKLKFLNEFKTVGEIRLGGGREENRSIVQSFK